ncbi:sulfurtransferase TusA family protein [Halorussus halophilus]|uniref:sulfurtransferase TusA family protein n=1 Tax=Halorussus halophilus TaxID=2650975 RepID=UPI0013019A55|nr:sulfurtransferase TusA family protein [Halorussus halophilus]
MTNSQIQADETVDARGATCPGPMMDLIGKVKNVGPGTVIELQSEESGSTTDVPEWVEKAGHELLDVVERDGYWSIYVKKHD